MSGYTTAEDDRAGGVRGVVSATLWAAGSVGVVTAVMMWAYDLGSRNPADVPALTAAGAWREAPEDPWGRRVPGADRLVYRSLTPDPSAAASVADAFGSAPVERAPDQDLAPPLEQIAQDRGAEIGSEAFASLSRAAARNPEASERRTILLDDPAQPQRAARDYLAPGAPSAPANLGAGSEPPPANAAFYRPEAATGDAWSRAASPARAPAEPAAVAAPQPAQASASPGSEGPPEAGPAAIEDRRGQPLPASTAQSGVAEPAAAPEQSQTVAEIAPAPQRPLAAQSGRRVYQVQLGALDSVRAVESRWEALRQREPELLGGFSLDIRPVNVGGARLYRLRVGAFDSRSEAATLCATLRSRGVECFPASG